MERSLWQLLWGSFRTLSNSSRLCAADGSTVSKAVKMTMCLSASISQQHPPPPPTYCPDSGFGFKKMCKLAHEASACIDAKLHKKDF